MIGHKYVPSREGGVEVVVDNLSTKLSSLNHNVTIFNRKRKEYKKINEYNGCKVEEIFTINKKSFDAVIYSFFATKKVIKLIKKGQVDVVHFHAEGPCLFLNKLAKLRKKYNFKIVVTIHGLDWQRGKWGGFASKMIKKGEENAVKYADEIIVLSKNVQNYFLETYNRQTHFIPNGVSKPVLRETNVIKEKYNLTKNNYILFLARIVPEKGLHYLLDAWNMIDETIRGNIKLVIAGNDAHMGEYYKDMIKKMNDIPGVIQTGFTQGRELEELYSNALFYVLPSDIEGMPMSLLEALSYANPSLVSDIPENLQVIPEYCESFKKSDVEDLKNKLILMIDKSRKLERKQFIFISWDDVVKQTLDIYGGAR